jgi:glyoxylase-like metal-dependent hydrolase (beta-lactamase superfamily II)
MNTHAANVEQAMGVRIIPFFDHTTGTFSYIVADLSSRAAAIIDPVLDFDPAAGRITTHSADAIVKTVEAEGLCVSLILETHIHADHLTAASYLKKRLGGELATGANVGAIQKHLSDLFMCVPKIEPGCGFDHLFEDNETFPIGFLEARVLCTPGHTPADVSYMVEDAVFIGDTLFMPDCGTARCDFPGGDARALYRSIRRILDLPPQTRLLVCHDYATGRACACETTVAAQRAENIHIHDGVTEEAFVALRTARDLTLPAPKLFLPSLQVNMRAGELPPPELNGRRYLKIPIDAPAHWP